MAEKLYTPKGIAVYPWLSKADTKFDPDGTYRTTLRIPTEEAQELVDKIEAIHAEAQAEETKKLPKGKKLKVADLPISTVYDDDGNETGEVDIKFKTKAKIKVGDKIIEKKLPMADAKGNKITEDIQIFGGSTIRLSFNAVPYNTSAGCGVSLRILGVQVIDLVSGGGSGGDLGFGAVEGGTFEASNDKPTSSSSESTDDDDENF
jgi:hypothetical protein